jgi:hypothetical protein
MKNDECYKSGELIEPFDIDDGSLKNMTPECVFVLVLKWQILRQKLLQ